MTALARLEASPIEDREPRARIPKDKGSFHEEIEHAKHEPAKTAAPARDKKPRVEDPGQPSPAVQLVSIVAVKRDVADLAEAVSFSPVTQVAAQGLDAMIEQSAAAATKQVAAAASDPDVPVPMTPLEQAVHDLIDRLRDPREDKEPGAEAVTIHAAPVAPAVFAPIEDRDVAAPVPVAPVREPEPEIEQAQLLNPSHIHLVIDEAERLVITVAVRGDNVTAHIRGGDDTTAAAFARNAATLDTAMRARGLQLTDFQASRDGFSDTEKDPPQRERETKQPKFTLEETP